MNLMNNSFTIDPQLDEYIKEMLKSWKFSRKEFDEWFNFIESKKDPKGYIAIDHIKEIRDKMWEIIKKRKEVYS